MTTPTVTILMPVYNAERYLALTIQSLLNQRNINFELIIINDGSSDSTLQIVKSFKNPRIRLINHRQNKGIAVRLNEGLRLARGQYIARADADDIYHPQRLEKQLKFLNKYQYGIVGTWAELIDEKGKTFGLDRRFNNHHFIKWSLLFGSCPLIHPSVMFDKKQVLDFDGYDPTWKHTEDYELWSRLANHTRMGILEKNLMSLRVHKQSVSRVNNCIQDFNTIKICQSNIEQFLGRPLGRKGFLLLKGWRLGKKYHHRRDVFEALALFQSVYDHFLRSYRPTGRTLELINHDYSQKLLKLLNINQIYDKNLVWRLACLEASVFRPLLYHAYLKNPQLFLSFGLNLLLLKHLINDFIMLLVQGWRKTLYRLYCLNQRLGLASLQKNFKNAS